MSIKYIIAASILLVTSFTTNATLVNLGNNGEYFYDTSSGLYWWDIATFVGQTKAEIDLFVATDVNRKYATAAEIDALMGQSSDGGVALTEIMGAHQFETFIAGDGTGSRWIGYFDETSADPGLPGDPDGWLAQTVLGGGLNDPSTIGDTGFQNNVITWNPGAWVNSRINPVPVPAAAWLFASGLLGLIGLARRKI